MAGQTNRAETDKFIQPETNSEESHGEAERKKESTN